MSISRKILVASTLVLLAIVGFVWILNNNKGYIEVTEDRANVCGYDADGKLTSSSLVAARQVKVRIPRTEYEQYKKNAIASNKCFY